METVFRLYQNIGDGQSENILEAIMHNDCKYVIDYYQAGFDIKLVDEKGETLLHKAARNDYFEIVDLLIKLGVDPNIRNNYRETPLHLAVQFKNSQVVDKLLFEGAAVNAQNRKKVSPLHLAASRGKESILHQLIAYNAKINIADENGAKPIHHGVFSGKIEIIRHLLNSGNSLIECDDRKNNVLHYACDAGDDKLVPYILRYMTVNNNRNIYQETALHRAAEKCSTATVKELLNHGYDLEAVNIYQQTPYDVAATKGNIDNAEFLQNYYQSVEYKERFERYPVHRAICANNYQLIMQLLTTEHINQFDYFAKTPIYYAIIIGSVKIVDYLYQRGARVDIVDGFNQPGLLIAIYNEDYPMIEYLLKRRAKVNEIFYGRSYLYRAILRNNYEIAKLLIDYGADVNYIDNRHRTIYSYALDYADDDLIELLVEKKALLI